MASSGDEAGNGRRASDEKKHKKSSSRKHKKEERRRDRSPSPAQERKRHSGGGDERRDRSAILYLMDVWLSINCMVLALLRGGRIGTLEGAWTGIGRSVGRIEGRGTIILRRREGI